MLILKPTNTVPCTKQALETSAHHQHWHLTAQAWTVLSYQTPQQGILKANLMRHKKMAASAAVFCLIVFSSTDLPEWKLRSDPVLCSPLIRPAPPVPCIISGFKGRRSNNGASHRRNLQRHDGVERSRSRLRKEPERSAEKNKIKIKK